jgi:hypothetical protein
MSSRQPNRTPRKNGHGNSHTENKDSWRPGDGSPTGAHAFLVEAMDLGIFIRTMERARLIGE